MAHSFKGIPCDGQKGESYDRTTERDTQKVQRKAPDLTICYRKHE